MTAIVTGSGDLVEADVIVTATGQKMQSAGGGQMFVDGQLVEPRNHFFYKGMMLSGVPNLAFALGYTNASWTLKCELTCLHVCRLIEAMEARGRAVAVAEADEDDEVGPWVG